MDPGGESYEYQDEKEVDLKEKENEEKGDGDGDRLVGGKITNTRFARRVKNLGKLIFSGYFLLPFARRVKLGGNNLSS